MLAHKFKSRLPYYYMCLMGFELGLGLVYFDKSSYVLIVEKIDQTYLAQLVSKLSQGDDASFQRLYEIFAKKIYHTSLKMNLVPEEAEEIVQEVFLKIWKYRNRLDPDRSINAYMLAIVKSLVLEKVRKNTRFIAFQRYQIHIEEAKTIGGPEEQFIFDEFHELSMELIENLPAAQKEVFKLKHFENQSVEEISKKLNVSRRTVENQIFRSTKYLKEGLKKLEIVGIFLCFVGIDYLVDFFII